MRSQTDTQTHWLPPTVPPPIIPLIFPAFCSTELTPELVSPAHYCLNWSNLISSLPVLNL